MDIFEAFQIDAAHRLPNVPKGHKCAQMHGHSFRIEIHIRGPVDSKLGWVMDFSDISDAFKPLCDQLDHLHPLLLHFHSQILTTLLAGLLISAP